MTNRVSWDEYFLKMAEITALRSACLSNQKGCVLVKDNRVLGTGYNGPPADILHCEYRNDTGDYPHIIKINSANNTSLIQNLKCPRQRMGFKSGEGLDECPAVHAEVNAILLARTDTRGAVLYCSFDYIPCRECSKIILNAGIKKIILNGEPKEYPQSGLTGRQILNLGHAEVINGRKTE
jgi:dCMP deaminase